MLKDPLSAVKIPSDLEDLGLVGVWELSFARARLEKERKIDTF